MSQSRSAGRFANRPSGTRTESSATGWVDRRWRSTGRRVSITPTSAALDPSVYGGSAGIALYLAHLYALTGEERFRRTATGGIARSIRQLGIRPTQYPISSLSLWCGDLGVAWVARRVADLTDNPAILGDFDRILGRVIEATETPHDLDVIGGNAGAIPALLELGQEPGRERCHALAIALGEELSRYDPARSGVRVPRPDRADASELEEFTPSGFSHGASGIGLALLELHSATGRLDFRDAARRTFDYEETLFDPQRGNWADLRAPLRSRSVRRCLVQRGARHRPCALRAAVLDPEHREEHLARVRIAIATTLKVIDKMLKDPRADATPCHGLSGLIGIVWIAGQMLDDSAFRDRALAAARAMIDRHAELGDWPSGLYSGGPNPSLMLGTAGVGYTFLRLHDPEKVPSVLLLVP